MRNDETHDDRQKTEKSIIIKIINNNRVIRIKNSSRWRKRLQAAFFLIFRFGFIYIVSHSFYLSLSSFQFFCCIFLVLALFSTWNKKNNKNVNVNSKPEINKEIRFSFFDLKQKRKKGSFSSKTTKKWLSSFGIFVVVVAACNCLAWSNVYVRQNKILGFLKYLPFLSSK